MRSIPSGPGGPDEIWTDISIRPDRRELMT